MKQATVLHILKLDAERRQLEVATRLYFFDATPVSIHPLGAASYGILRDYAVSKDVELQTAEQGILRRVVQGKKGDLMVALRSALWLSVGTHTSTEQQDANESDYAAI